MKILKLLLFPVVVFLLLIFSIISLFFLAAAMIVKIFGEAWLTLKAIYEN